MDSLEEMKEEFYERTRLTEDRRMRERYAAETKRNAKMTHLEKLLVCLSIKRYRESNGQRSNPRTCH